QVSNADYKYPHLNSPQCIIGWNFEFHTYSGFMVQIWLLGPNRMV
ncbi:unnamed protein product, partial [Rotaria socialis]